MYCGPMLSSLYSEHFSSGNYSLHWPAADTPNTFPQVFLERNEKSHYPIKNWILWR